MKITYEQIQQSSYFEISQMTCWNISYSGKKWPPSGLAYYSKYVGTSNANISTQLIVTNLHWSSCRLPLSKICRYEQCLQFDTIDCEEFCIKL